MSLPLTADRRFQSHTTQAAVFVGDVKPIARCRIEHLLGMIGLPTRQVESPGELAECVVLGAAGCLLLDPERALCNGVDWFDSARAGVRPLPIVCVSAQPSIGAAVRAMQAGAWTYLDHTVSDDDLLEEIQQAIQADRQRESAAAQVAAWRTQLAVLTVRERETLHYTTEGLTSRDIAARMGVSHRTVDSHRGNILRKVGVKRLSELTLVYCTLLANEETSAARRMSNLHVD